MQLPDGTELLDNPAWSALSGRLSHLGEGGPLARGFFAEVSPFAGLRASTPANLRALGDLLGQDSSAMLLSPTALPSVDGMVTNHLFDVLQMIDRVEVGGADDSDILELSATDAAEMLALVQRTKPGPFGPRTGEMGRYIGLRRDGRLIAMAGQRLQFGRYCEISAVCVDEAYRGLGLAQRLMNCLRRDIRAQGRVPILHVRTDAIRTIRLYEVMGFKSRKTLALYHVAQVQPAHPSTPSSVA